MKRNRILSLFLALSMALMLAACGGGDSGSNDSNSNSGSNSGSNNSSGGGDTGKVYELSMSMHDPATSNNGKFYQNWADQIEAATDGHVKITIFYSGTLASSSDVVDMVKGGGVDIGWVYTSFYPNQYPLTDVISLVLEGFESPAATTNALWDLYDSTPELQAEWSDFKLLNMYANPAALICTNDSPVTSVSDMAGRSLRCPAGMISTVLTSWGASPIMMGPGDIYQALEKNNISGCIFEPAGITNFTLQEQLHYYTDMPLYQGPFLVVMNSDKWNSLPAEYQDVIMSFSGREGSIAAADDFNAAAEAAKQVMIDAGGQYVPVSDAAYAEFRQAAAAASDSWATGLSTGDFDAGAYLEHARELVAQYNAAEG